MATFDAHKNLAKATVAVAPSPATSGTSLTITAGFVSLFPAVPFNATVYPPNVAPTAANAEIVRVTNITGDIFTITRAQESSTAKSIAVGWTIANTISAKVITDIEAAINLNVQSISAGAGVATSNQIVFSNANGVSFGAAAGSVITASFSGGGGGGGGAAISAGANSQSTGTVVFSASNGVTFGLSNNGVMTASHDGVTSQSNQAFSAQGGSTAFQTLNFANSNGITFSNSNGSVVASHNGLTSQSNQAASASNGSFAFQTLAFSDANGVTFGTSAGSIITASVGAGGAAGSISAGTASVALGQVVFSNSNGVSFGLDGSTVTAAHDGLTSQSAQAASASNGSFAFQTLAFSNANNVTFGTSAGSIITASVATAAAGNSVNFSAGTSSANLGSIVFSNSNGVSFGLNGATITASASGGGGAGFTASIFEAPVPLNNNTSIQNYSVNGRIVFDQFNLPFNLSFNQIQQIFSASVSFTPASVAGDSTGSFGITHSYVIYTRSVTDSGATNFSNSSIILSHISQTWTMQVSTAGSSSSKSASYFWMTDSTGGSSSSSQSTNSSNMAVLGMSQRILIGIPFVNSLSAGEYWMGRLINTSATNNADRAWQNSVYELSWNANSTNRSSFGDTGGGNDNGNNMFLPGQGFYSASSLTIPTSVNLVDDVVNSNFGFQARRYYQFKP